MKKKRQDLDFIPNRHRCLHCLKFRARDPKKVGDDEVAQLKFCSGCNIAEYCSEGDCQEKHAPVHKWFCKPIQNFKYDEIAWQYNSLVLTWSHDCKVVEKPLSKKDSKKLDSLHMINLFVQGILSQNGYMLGIFRTNNYDGILANPFVDDRAKAAHYLTKETCITAFLLGDWEYVHMCTKTELMRNAQRRFNLGNIPMPKHLAKCGVRDNIIKALKKDKLFDVTKFTEERDWHAYHYADYLLIAAIGKIHVIEDMKWQLLQHHLHIQKTRPRKKFFHRPRILNLLTVYILGKNVDDFEKDIAEQEKHLKDILQAIDDVHIGLRAIGTTYLHELLADASKKFSLDDKVWLDVSKARKVEQYVLHSNFIWNYYFSVNSIAKEYVKAFMNIDNRLSYFKKQLKAELPSDYYEQLNSTGLGKIEDLEE